MNLNLISATSTRLADMLHKKWLAHRGIYASPTSNISRKSTLICQNGSIYIGSRTILKPHSVLHTGPNGSIRLGSNCSVNYNCVLYGHGGLVIGNDVRIGAGTIIIPSEHVYHGLEPITTQGTVNKGIVIGNDVWIGANCSILDGVSIGAHVVIGAGSVVTKSIPSNSVAYGVPAAVRRPTSR